MLFFFFGKARNNVFHLLYLIWGVSGYDGELLSRLSSTTLIKEMWITKYVFVHPVCVIL